MQTRTWPTDSCFHNVRRSGYCAVSLQGAHCNARISSFTVVMLEPATLHYNECHKVSVHKGVPSPGGEGTPLWTSRIKRPLRGHNIGK
jgi:hypothetical protein